MATRTVGKTKLTLEVRQRLVEVAAEARRLVYGSAGCPEWGTKFAEIEADAREVGFGLMRLLMEQTNTQQARQVPAEALQAESSEVATPIGTEDRTLETEALRPRGKNRRSTFRNLGRLDEDYRVLPSSSLIDRQADLISLSRRHWACALTRSCLRR